VRRIIDEVKLILAEKSCRIQINTLHPGEHHGLSSDENHLEAYRPFPILPGSLRPSRAIGAESGIQHGTQIEMNPEQLQTLAIGLPWQCLWSDRAIRMHIEKWMTYIDQQIGQSHRHDSYSP
jgi:hypothetical protein